MDTGRAVRTSSFYDPHPSLAYKAAILANLPRTTGRGLEEWIALVEAQPGLGTATAMRDWLKAEHGLGTTTAWFIAERAAGEVEPYEPEALVEAMFAGKKAALRPIYDRLLSLGKSLGPDVRACPCKTIVPLYRNHVFAELKPTTLTRIDLGLALGDLPATGRLIDTRGLAKKDRITHRIPITSVAEIDAEVERWLRAAYERDG